MNPILSKAFRVCFSFCVRRFFTRRRLRSITLGLLRVVRDIIAWIAKKTEKTDIDDQISADLGEMISILEKHYGHK